MVHLEMGFQSSYGHHTNDPDTFAAPLMNVRVGLTATLNISSSDIDMFDAGVAYFLTDDIQLDINFGISIDRNSSDYIGAGLAIRF